MARTTLAPRRALRSRCRLCGSPMTYVGKGRPRVLCVSCRPPGTPPPSKAAQEFRATSEAESRARREAARDRARARRRALRRLIDAHPDEYARYLTEEAK